MGDEIETNPGSTVSIFWPDGSMLTLGENSQGTIGSTAPAAAQPTFLQALRSSLIAMIFGSATVNLQEHSGVQLGFSLARIDESSLPPPTPKNPLRADDQRLVSDQAINTSVSFTATVNPSSQFDTISVQAGALQIIPANPSLAPFTLQAGSQVQVGPKTVSPITPSGGTPPPPSPSGGPPVGGSLLQIAQALDVNHNNKIDDDEIKTADVDWTTNQMIAGTNLTIGDDAMKQLFQMWVTSAPITAAGTSAAGTTRLPGLQVRAIEARTLDTHSVRFVVEGQGVTGMEAQVFDLSGRLIFNQDMTGTTLTFRGLGADGRPLANGVYLYTVSVRGSDGSVVRNEVRKLVLLR
jgi:hypothetical protein